MGKLARTGAFTDYPYYECKKDWPEDCFVQGGDNGIVFTEGAAEDSFTDPEGTLKTILSGEGRRHYRTAFFEAFPRNPNTFIRGEGATIEEAETQAWEEYQRYLVCPGPNGHEYEARGYENGGGICKHCGMFGSKVIAPVHKCEKCGELTWYSKDNQGGFWCENCYNDVPEELKTETRKMLDRMKAEMEEWEAK
jgi:hypothetical protein